MKSRLFDWLKRATPKTLTLHVAVDPDSLETGVWCDRCFLPSAVRVSLIVSGVGELATFTHCENCNEDQLGDNSKEPPP